MGGAALLTLGRDGGLCVAPPTTGARILTMIAGRLSRAFVTLLAYRAPNLVCLSVLPQLLVSVLAARTGDHRQPPHRSGQLHQPLRDRFIPDVALRVAAGECIGAGNNGLRVGDAQHAVFADLDVAGL